MGRIFITGSSDGLGLGAAKILLSHGHTVYLHARSAQRAADARAACPGAADVFIGDLTSIEETKALAASLSKLGPLDCILHSAGIYLGPFREQANGYPAVFVVNMLAPYLLTCLTPLPKRLLIVTSAVQLKAPNIGLGDFGWRDRHKAGHYDELLAYAESKLAVTTMCNALARRYANKGLVCNAIDPGWVPTKMGGPNAPGDISVAEKLYVMAVEGVGESLGGSGLLWRYGEDAPSRAREDTYDEGVQNSLLDLLRQITGVTLPE